MSESSLWRDEMAALLVAEGYTVHLDARGDADLEAWPLEVAVVDLSASTGPGPTVVELLRARTSIPILAVSSEAHPESVVLDAYAAGADQFVTRGVRPRELVARIRALQRRSPQRQKEGSPAGSAGLGVSLDLTTRVATVAGVRVELSYRESEVLHTLLQRPGRVVTREQLGASRWSREVSTAVDSAVRSVRAKLEAAEGCRRIVAVRAVGFRLLHDAELAILAADVEVGLPTAP